MNVVQERPSGVVTPSGVRRGRLGIWVLGFLLALLVGLAAKEPEILLPIGSDQGTYSYVAERILEGGLPYVDAWDNKPPATYYVHAAVLALVPRGQQWSGTCIEGTSQPCGYVALQIADVLWTGLSGLALLAVARALGFTPLGAISATVLFMLFANLSQLSKEGSTPEKQLLLPMLVSYLLVLESRGRQGWLVAAGVAAGVAFLFKQTAVSIPAALLVWGIWRNQLTVRAVASFAAGYVLPLTAVAGYFASRGGLGALWDASFGYNVVQAGTNWLRIPRGMLTGAWHVFSGSSAALWLLGIGGLPAAWSDRTRSLLACWAAADALSLVLGGSKFAQVYFVQLVPSSALLGGLAIARAWQATENRRLLRGYAAVAAISLLLLSSQLQAEVAMRAWNERTPGHSSTPAEHLIADRIAEQRAGQPVFVWGDNSEVYLYANARAPGRFFQTFALSRQYAEAGYRERRQELLRSWVDQPPAVIAIDSATSRDDPDGSLGLNVNSFPELQALLARNYQRANGENEGWQLFKRTS